MCCLLKYVEENYRKGGLSKWSVRQMGFYQQYNCIDKLDTSILFHPSDMFWGRIKAEMKDNPNGEPTWGHWTSMPLLLFKSLSANWQDYVTFLHDKAVAIVRQPFQLSEKPPQSTDHEARVPIRPSQIPNAKGLVRQTTRASRFVRRIWTP